MTQDEAYDEITTRVLDRWTALTPAIVGMVPELRFADVEKPEIPDETFARFVMDPVDGPQAGMRNGEYGQRYEENGIIIIQLLVWRKQNPEAGKQIRQLGQMGQDIFRDPAFPGCYVFNNVRLNKLDPEAKYLRANVIVEYQFDHIG